jgi:hypothetical protein
MGAKIQLKHSNTRVELPNKDVCFRWLASKLGIQAACSPKT